MTLDARMKLNKRKLLIMGVIMGVLIVTALFAEKLCWHDPYLVNLAETLKPPSSEYWFGTDQLGRCMACRILSGLKYTLFSSLAIVVITSIVGVTLGICGAYFGKATDKALLYLNVVFQAFPGFVLAIFIASLLGNSLINGILALSFTGWTLYARFSRSLSQEIIGADYIKSAKLSGLWPVTVIVRHILPNIMVPVVVTMALSVSDAVIGIAGLSFLGIGASPPTPEWGTIMSESRVYLQTAPWTVIAPGMALFALVMCFNMFADALRRVLDPRGERTGVLHRKRASRKNNLKPASEANAL
jgi:ABC-type dipeptide/oligopeptide/nickel transport system permease subunit